MKRNDIIKHYKNFFGLENIGLAENDQLMIDWAENLVKDCNLPDVSQQRELLLAFASYVNKNELREADDQITDYSIKAFLKANNGGLK